LLLETQADELMVLCTAPVPEARRQSYQLLATLWPQLQHRTGDLPS
jgi:hypothetical protein